jgi:phosphate uptake regulator
MARTYSTIWRCKGLADDAATLDDMIAALREAIAELTMMRDAGITLSQPMADDYAFLVTTDPEVAERFGMELDEDEDEDDDVDPFSLNGHHG